MWLSQPDLLAKSIRRIGRMRAANFITGIIASTVIEVSSLFPLVIWMIGAIVTTGGSMSPYASDVPVIEYLLKFLGIASVMVVTNVALVMGCINFFRSLKVPVKKYTINQFIVCGLYAAASTIYIPCAIAYADEVGVKMQLVFPFIGFGFVAVMSAFTLINMLVIKGKNPA